MMSRNRNQQTLLSCPLVDNPIVDDPMTRYSHEFHGLILVPVTGDGLFRRIGTFVTLRYLSYPKQMEYQREKRNVSFKCKEVTVIHEGGFLKQKKGIITLI